MESRVPTAPGPRLIREWAAVGESVSFALKVPLYHEE